MRKMFSLVLIALIGCIDEPVSEKGILSAQFRVSDPLLMEGRIRIHEAYLKPQNMEITGQLKSSTSLSPADPPFRLNQADSTGVAFSIQPGTYQDISLVINLPNESYALIRPDDAQIPDVPSDPAGGGGAENEAPGNGTTTGGTNDNTAGDETNTEQDDHSSGNDDHSADNDSKHNDSQGEKEEQKEEAGEQKDGDNDKSGGDESTDNKENDKKKQKDKHKSGDKKQDKGKKKGDKDKKGGDDDKDKDGKKGRGEKGDDDNDRKKGRGNGGDDDDDDNRKKHGNGRVSDAPVDLQHFFQNARPGLVVIASYAGTDKTITIIFVVTEPIRINIKRKESGTPVHLQSRNTADVVFWTDAWFADITSAMLEKKATQPYQGQEILFIHKENNTDLYDVLLSRIIASASVSFQADTDQP